MKVQDMNGEIIDKIIIINKMWIRKVRKNNQIIRIHTRDKSKLPTRTILVLIEEAITTTMALTIQLLTATTTIRPTATTTLAFVPHSNIISDYIF